jgi:hypothetical protein
MQPYLETQQFVTRQSWRKRWATLHRFEPMAWKTARFRAEQAAPDGSTATIYKC